jgi:hypothetical protein
MRPPGANRVKIPVTLVDNDLDRDCPNHVRALFTSVGNEADRIGPTQSVGFTHIDSHVLRALHEAPCGSGRWSSGCFPNKVEFIPHQSKGCRLIVSFGEMGPWRSMLASSWIGEIDLTLPIVVCNPAWHPTPSIPSSAHGGSASRCLGR